MIAPAHLDEQARQKWAEVLPILESRGDVDQGALDALACYCSAWSRWTAAEAEVAKLGTVVKSPAGFPVPNPYLTVAKDAQRQMRQWGDVLQLHKRPGRKAAEPESAVSLILRQMDDGQPSRTPRKKKATA
jgi:P27 family predicted phage terminase small subunit